MLERIIGDDLHRGDFSEARKRLARIEEILTQQILKAPDTAPLQLLAARLADAIGDARKTDLYIGRILASEWLVRGEIKAAVDRFCVRLALNRGEIAEARHLIDRVERMVTLIPIGQGSEHEEIIDREDAQVSAATWLLSAEVALQENNPTRAEFDLERAADKFALVAPAPDDMVFYDLLAGLARLHKDDPAGAAAIAQLYRSHVGGDHPSPASPLEAQTVARLAAACGRIDQAAAINNAEAERWSALGAVGGAWLDKYLNDRPQPDPAAAEIDDLPETELLIGLLEETLTPFQAAPEINAAAPGAEGFSPAEQFPLEFSLEHTRLDSVTSMLDLDRDTGALEINWAGCAPGLVAEAIASGAISDAAAHVSRGTIYFNEGAYVDARFDGLDDDMSLAPADILFELFRIAMARIPGSRARQIIDDPGAPHIPERFHQRPNHLNLDMSARLDHLHGRVSPNEDDLQAEAVEHWHWDAAPESEAPPRDLRSSDTAQLAFNPSQLLTTLSGIFAAATVAEICAATHEAVSELKISSAVMIVAAGQGETAVLGACGVKAIDVARWSEREAGPLMVRVGVAEPSALNDHDEQCVAAVLQAAAHRLRVVPGVVQRGPSDDTSLIAADPHTQKLLRLVRQFAALDGSGPHHKLQHVMIVGERGVGKELIAQALHRWSARAEKPFRAVNMSRLNRELAPAEIFGARKGSYTGATADRRGLIQQFAGGTLFLDEIDEADDKVQAMLKRVVEYGTYERVGDPAELHSDVRFVVATNRVAQDRSLIKEDLRDRFWEIRVPPLRERRADIRPLAEHFARQHEYALPEPVLAWLESPALFWPGNVRQLQSAVERACSLAHDASELTLDFFRQCVTDAGPPPHDSESFNEDSPGASLREGETLEARLQKIERAIILRALADAGGNKTQAAERLGGTRQWLYKRCHALKIQAG